MVGTGSVRKSARTVLPDVAPTAHHVPLLEDRHAAPGILPDRFDEREMRAAPRAAAHLDPVVDTRATSGTSGTRSMPKRPPGFSTRETDSKRRDQVAIATAATAGCRTPRGRSRSGRRRTAAADVAADERHVAAPPARVTRRGLRRCRRAPASAPIDRCRRVARRRARAAARSVRCRIRARAPARATSGDHPLPERHVAAAERPRVLPVVEGRVLVPALPALAFRHRRVILRSMRRSG